MSLNPFAPPESDLTTMSIEKQAPPLWNANAAACWSLLFSPAFGAYLHMRNWQALGDDSKAAAAKTWMIVSIVMMLAAAMLAVLFARAKGVSAAVNIFGLGLLISWYVVGARAQVADIKERFGDNYPRKGWGKPLGVAALAIIAYFVAMIIMGALVAMARA